MSDEPAGGRPPETTDPETSGPEASGLETTEPETSGPPGGGVTRPSATDAATADDRLTPILGSLLRSTLPAATVPLLLFTIVFIAWLAAFWSGRDGLQATLAATLLAAGVMVLLGVAAGGASLLLGVWRGVAVTSSAVTPEPRRRLIKHAGFHATLLVINLPAVFLMGTVAVGLTDRSFVRLDNRSTAAVSDLTLADESGDHPLGGVPPRTAVTLRLKPASEFTLSGLLGEESVDLGAFDLGPEGRVEGAVTIAPDRSVTVEGGQLRQAMGSGSGAGPGGEANTERESDAGGEP